MKTNKIDKNIKEKFAKRSIAPSASAWERLSVKLDEQPKQKKIGWFFYIGAAASILLLVSLGIQLFSSDKEIILPKNNVVLEQIDKSLIDKKLEKLKNEIPVKEVIVKIDEVENRQEESFNNNNIILKNEEPKKRTINKKLFKKRNEIIIAKVEEKVTIMPKEIIIPTKMDSQIKPTYKQDPNSSIKINSEDLLYAVTHTPKEVKVYYAKYNINRDDVLKTIQNQLKESNIKINPNTILAEVERTIDDDDFQNNFMKSLKRRVTDIASAIASRND